MKLLPINNNNIIIQSNNINNKRLHSDINIENITPYKSIYDIIFDYSLNLFIYINCTVSFGI